MVQHYCLNEEQLKKQARDILVYYKQNLMIEYYKQNLLVGAQKSSIPVGIIRMWTEKLLMKFHMITRIYQELDFRLFVLHAQKESRFLSMP